MQKGSTLKVIEEFNIQGKQTSFYKYCPGTFWYILVHPVPEGTAKSGTRATRGPKAIFCYVDWYSVTDTLWLVLKSLNCLKILEDDENK